VSFGRLASIVFLFGAAAVLPPILARLSPGASMARSRIQELSRLAGEAGSPGAAPSMPEDLRGMVEQAEEDPSSFSPEEREILQDMRELGEPKGSMEAPVLRKLAEAAGSPAGRTASVRSKVRSAYEAFLSGYERRRSGLMPLLWGLPLSLAALAVLGILFSSPALTRLFARAGFGLCRLWLSLLAWGAAGLALAAWVNPWLGLPREFLAAPLSGLLACALLLRLNDMNYPVWNPLLTGCLSPIASALFAFGVLAVKARL
jgi:hypothetical protein